jgi:hypothetical protein
MILCDLLLMFWVKIVLHIWATGTKRMPTNNVFLYRRDQHWERKKAGKGGGTLVDGCNALCYGIKYGVLIDSVPVICVPSFLSL